MHIDDSVATSGADDQPYMDEMSSFNNSEDDVKDFIATNNHFRQQEKFRQQDKTELEIDLLKTKKALAKKHLEIAEVELEIKKTILAKEKKALAQMSLT